MFMESNALHIIIGIYAIAIALTLAVTATLIYLFSKAVDAFEKLCTAASVWLYASANAIEKKQKPVSSPGTHVAE